MSKGIATAAAVSFLLTACDSSPTPEHVEHGLSEFFERAKWVNTLPPPPNASASKVGGGSTSGEREHFEFVVETTLSPEQVRDHYVGQLESRGWQASQRLQEGALALQTFHFVDESSTKWQGVLQTAANASQSDRVVVHLSLNRVPEATVQ